jgi:long-subunit acyl-CoA synthetase (AMP-forming)
MNTVNQLLALKEEFKRQDFNFTKEQQERYDVLLNRRREEVKQWYKDGKVWIGPSNVGKALAE